MELKYILLFVFENIRLSSRLSIKIARFHQNRVVFVFSFLHQQLAHSFSLMDSPVWMDSSTGPECRELESEVGGPLSLARVTGCVAQERLTANQIRKVWKEKPEVWANTERVSLVSSFLCSIFVGDYVGIDMADGSGMNLLDLRNRAWSQQCLQVNTCYF